MDVSCIISSGDLELYVLGMLPEEEMKQVEQLMSILPEVRAEVDRISETLGLVGNQMSPAPRAVVREQVFEKFKELKHEMPQMKSVTTVEERKENKIIPIRKERNAYLVAASVIGVVVGISALVLLFSQVQKKNSAIAELQQQVQTTNQQIAAQQQQLTAYEQLRHIVQDPDFKPVILASVPGKPEGSVKLFWNPNSTEVYVVNVSLPTAPPQKQYQLWAIVDGKPVNAGLIDPSATTQKMERFAKADAFAITLENRGGSESPTLTEMYVMGKPS